MPNGPHKITGLPFDLDAVESDKKIDDLDINVSQNDKLGLLLRG